MSHLINSIKKIDENLLCSFPVLFHLSVFCPTYPIILSFVLSCTVYILAYNILAYIPATHTHNRAPRFENVFLLPFGLLSFLKLQSYNRLMLIVRFNKRSTFYEHSMNLIKNQIVKKYRPPV